LGAKKIKMLGIHLLFGIVLGDSVAKLVDGGIERF